MKTGMTNDSYVFECCEGTFIIRIPGKGSEALINRRQEFQVYELLKGRGIADDVVYFDPESGIKSRASSPERESAIRNPKRILRRACGCSNLFTI